MGKLIKPLSAHDIYEYLTSGGGTSMLDEAQAATRAEYEHEEHRAQLIRKQTELIRDGWEGTAADAAAGTVEPIAVEGLEGVVLLGQAKETLDRQSAAFHQAKNSVVPVPPDPPEMDIIDMMTPFSDYEQQVRDYQAEVQHNIEVFRSYDEASGLHERIMGEYRVSDDSADDVSVTSDGTEPGDSDDDGADREQPRGESGPPPGGRAQPGGDPTGSPGGDPTDTPGGTVPATRPPQTTTPSGVLPPTVTAPGFSSPVQPTGPAPGGAVAGVPVGGYSGGGTGGPGTRGWAYGGGPGAGGRGPGGAVRPGVPGAGPGAGALAAEEAAARRAASAATARGAGAGMMGGAPVGGGRGKGDDDEEHRRKVLIEEDAEGLFGSDVLTAPQVIGDDAYEDD